MLACGRPWAINCPRGQDEDEDEDEDEEDEEDEDESESDEDDELEDELEEDELEEDEPAGCCCMIILGILRRCSRSCSVTPPRPIEVKKLMAKRVLRGVSRGKRPA